MVVKNSIRDEIISGSIFRSVMIIVFPILCSHFLETAWHFLNGFWVGKLGPVSFAAVNISSFIVWMFYAFLGIMNVGTNSLVAQMDGAKEDEKAHMIAHQGILGNVILSLFFSIFVLVFGRWIFRHMGAEPLVVEEAYKYTFIIFVFGVFFGLMDIISAILRGYGDTKTPLIALTAGCILTFVLDPLLILGIGPFPKYGIAGGGIAAVIGFSLSVFIFIIYISKGLVRFKFSWRLLKYNNEQFREIVRIGLPTSISSITFSFVYIILTRIIAMFGTEAMAAVGIGHRIESISFLICFGFSLTAITIVGQNVGAEKIGRAVKAAWGIVGIVVMSMFFVAVTYYFFSYQLSSIFINDPRTLIISSDYLKIVSICQIFMGLAIVLDGTFSGAGNTLQPMMINVPVTLLRIPLAYYMAVKLAMGINGVWWAITILVIIRGLLNLVWFLLGYWKNQPEKRLLRDTI